MAEPIGIIAGGGRLPVVIAEGMRAAGRQVCCIGLRGHYSKEIIPFCDRFAVAGTVRLGTWIRLCRKFGVKEAVLVGRVDKGRLHDPLRLLKNIPDLRTMNIWYRRLRHDRRSAAVLRSIAEELGRCGVTLIDSTAYIPDHMATEGVLTRNQPTPAQHGDLKFGWSILSETVELGIGQAITVHDRDVIAVEAIEGTDQLITRTGELCQRHGWSLLKTSSRNHDRRTDVPTIGVKTIEMLQRNGASCLMVGAGRVILLDKPLVIEAAERAGISIIGVGDDGLVGG